MSEKVINFLTALAPHFPKRHESEDAQRDWIADWIRAFRNAEPWVLEQAAKDIIDTRSERSHPLVAEVRKVCEAVCRREAKSQPQLNVRPDQGGDRYALADHLINSNLGRQAAQDNPSWVLSLHDFCREQGRLPEPREVAMLKRFAAECEEDYARCVAGTAGPFSVNFEKLGASFLRRRQGLRERLLGKDTQG